MTRENINILVLIIAERPRRLNWLEMKQDVSVMATPQQMPIKQSESRISSPRSYVMELNVKTRTLSSADDRTVTHRAAC